ncbi:hypothetical protein AYK86_00015 [Acinetobacter venetianus]|uniref:hypothetical protein n=1 Tax=Acinetobacter venetianus TaxID=52133 RepID=UPI000775E5F4|nr:hypothetical protein [Acinetobacter venetianus]KXO87070.1 hypothetical protein AYK86_00015 [Acinetobacter venetianus]
MKILFIIRDEPLIFFSFLCLFLFLLFLLIQYIYISFNLKGINNIIFNDEKHFKLPLEPFNCFFISVLPVVFWRETLSVKKGFKFKRLYRKEFYYDFDENQLKEILKKYPFLFFIQYVIYFSSILFILLGGIAYILEKFFS